MQKSEFLKTGLLAAKKAEEVIMRYYSGEIDVKLKDDETPVTAADREAEQVIIKTIKSEFPDHSILGEEYGNNSSDSEYTWIIDPIDGTKNYIRKIPMFATQIALMKDRHRFSKPRDIFHRKNEIPGTMKNNELILGISNAPALNELLYAEKGRGSYCNNKKIRVSSKKNLKEGFMSFGGINYFKNLGLIPNLLELADSMQGKRGFGDFWGYHLLAQGKIEVMVEADIKIWDIAALVVIVEEAGGEITDLKGRRVTRDVGTVAASNGVLHEEVLRIFRK